MDQYSIIRAYEADYRIKGSKFLAFLTPCSGAEKIEWKIESIRELHPAATHHCYAYRIDPVDCKEYSQDNGEPAGTAGVPILNEMKSAGLVNALCIVVRYYGGIKLGKRGLIDAYSTTARVAIQKAELKKIVPTICYSIKYPYRQQSLIEKLKHTFTLFESGSDYTEEVQLLLECPLHQHKNFEKKLHAIAHLLISVDKRDVSYHIVS